MSLHVLGNSDRRHTALPAISLPVRSVSLQPDFNLAVSHHEHDHGALVVLCAEQVHAGFDFDLGAGRSVGHRKTNVGVSLNRVTATVAHVSWCSVVQEVA